MTADTITAIKKAMEDLDALVTIVANDTGALVMSDPDEDSVGSTLEGDLEMTFGHVRRAHQALSTLESLRRENERLRQFLFPYADNTEISGISWDGKYLIGDKASISAFREMQNRGLQIDIYKRAYDEKVAALKARTEATEARESELRKALADIIEDLEMRSENGVVDCSHGVYFAAKAALSAQVQDVAIPEGWQLVPKEPNDEMHNAARDWAIEKYGMGVGRDGSDGCYRAMLAAAPAAKLDGKP